MGKRNRIRGIWWRVALLSSVVAVFLVSLVLRADLGSVTAAVSEPGQPAQPDIDSVAEQQGQELVPVRVYLPIVCRQYRPPSFFGVHMRSVTDPYGLQQALAAGVSRVRTLAFRWDKIEPVRTTPPTYHWETVNEASLINAYENHIDVLAMIQFTPAWAQKVPGYYCGPIAQEHLDEFAHFLSALVSRYSAAPYGVRFYELGNEPDVDPSLVNPDSWFGCWGDDTDEFYGGGYYAEMLKVATPAIKNGNHEARVYVGGLLLDCDPNNPPPGNDCKSSKFLEGILDNGGGPFFDVVSFHAYTYYRDSLGQMANYGWSGSETAIPEKTAFLQSVLEQYGYGDKPLVNSEAAMLCLSVDDDCLETQAMYVPRAFAEALALGLKTQYYYEMIGGWGNVGLIWSDLTPKPVYDAYVTAISFLGNARYMHDAFSYPPGVEGYSFLRLGDRTEFDVIWSVDGLPHNVTLPEGSSAYDRYGSLIGTSMTIEVGASPVYVVHP